MNKLIAEYMGVRPLLIEPDLYVLSDSPWWSVTAHTPEKAWEQAEKSFRYSTSWDALMPVIGKISLSCEEMDELDSLKYYLLCNNIGGAYRWVIDYLKINT